MADPTDDLLQALVTAREGGMSRIAVVALVHDTFDAPWEAGLKAAACRHGPPQYFVGFRTPLFPVPTEADAS